MLVSGTRVSERRKKLSFAASSLASALDGCARHDGVIAIAISPASAGGTDELIMAQRAV